MLIQKKLYALILSFLLSIMLLFVPRIGNAETVVHTDRTRHASQRTVPIHPPTQPDEYASSAESPPASSSPAETTLPTPNVSPLQTPEASPPKSITPDIPITAPSTDTSNISQPSSYLLPTATQRVSTPHYTGTPHPMTYEEALNYQSKYPKEILTSNFKTKDKYGNKNVERIFDLMGKKGFVNSGPILSTVSDMSALRLCINYGFANDPKPPEIVLA